MCPISPSLYQEILDIAVSDHDIFNTSYKDAWRYIKRALPEQVPNGQATHVLRHTFASHFMMNKGDILVLQRILGHTKIRADNGVFSFCPRAFDAGCSSQSFRELVATKWRQPL